MKKLFFVISVVFSFSFLSANTISSDEILYDSQSNLISIKTNDRCKFHHDLLARSCVGTNAARCAGAQLNLLFRGCW